MSEDSALAQLIGAYLNQDLFDFYPDVMSGVDDFTSEAPELASALPREIDGVLARHPDDEALAGLLTQLGVGFIAGDLTYREWLIRIAERVRVAVA